MSRKTHGFSKTTEYRIWQGIRKRCHNPKDPNYKFYGAKGIKVCARWEKSFLYFYKDMGKRPSTGHSIDRINNKKGYFPNNCRWATRKEQARNTNRSVILTYGGKSMCLIDWAKYLGIKHATLQERLEKWPLKKALTKPRVKNHQFQNRRFLTLNGQTLCLFDWSRKLSIGPSVIRKRIINGWSIEEALTTPLDRSMQRWKKSQQKNK